MLNPFPELLNFAILGPFILRVILGLIFIDLGILKFKVEKGRWLAAFEVLHLRPTEVFVPLYGLLQVVGGAMLIVGAYTQVASLAFVIFTGLELFVEWKAQDVLKRDITFYILILGISLSLLLTGAGAYAFDLPL